MSTIKMMGTIFGNNLFDFYFIAVMSSMYTVYDLKHGNQNVQSLVLVDVKHNVH